MNVHGIYDTKAYMLIFESKEQYQEYQEKQSGYAFHILGFSHGSKNAFALGTNEDIQLIMAQMNIDIDRWEATLLKQINDACYKCEFPKFALILCTLVYVFVNLKDAILQHRYYYHYHYKIICH